MARRTAGSGCVGAGGRGDPVASRAGVVRGDDRGVAPSAFGSAVVADDHSGSGAHGAAFRRVRRGWPWQWRAEQLDAWVAQGGWAHSTIRGYQGSVALFLEYLCDPHYGWAQACMERVGEIPTQICHEWNTATHVSVSEGRPERRPLTRDELQRLFDVADEAVVDDRPGRAEGMVGGVSGCHAVQGGLWVGFAPPGDGHARCR